MSNESPGATLPKPTAGPPGWRLGLLLIVLGVTAAACLFFGPRFESPEQAGRRLCEHLFRGEISEALEALENYRRLAMNEVPPEVAEDIFRLKAHPAFPVYREQADGYLVEEIASLCCVSSQAVRPPQDFRSAAVNVLEYLAANFSSVAGNAESVALGATPLHLLWRGHGRPVESAWLMALLLRYRGIHACVIPLPAAQEGGELYAVTGVIIDKDLHLFDPYRGVAICRSGDGAVAVLSRLLSGRDTFAPGFGGPGTPVTLEALRKAFYLVPADAGSVIPDAWLIGKAVRDNGYHGAVYRSFRRDIRNVAAAVFGEGARVKDHFTALTSAGHEQTVALWEYPFVLQSGLSDPDYSRRVIEANRNLFAYLDPRIDQLRGEGSVAWEKYNAMLAESGEQPVVAEDISFFRSSVAPALEERASLLDAYLRKYPAGRWRPHAEMLLAELDARLGRSQQALDRATHIPAPYDLRGRLLAESLRAGRKQIEWSFPQISPPVPPPK